METPEARDLAAFEEVTGGFYRNPDAELAAGALRHWLRMVAEADEEQIARMFVLLYLFARIMQTSSSGREAFEPILRGYEGPHAELAQRLLQAADDPSFPSAMRVPVERPEILDMLWADFFVTGEAAPIERIFGVLDGEDRVRSRLEAWLRERSLLGGSKRRLTASTLASVGLVVDLDREVIVTDGDLDCLCFRIAEQRVPIFSMLPFELTGDDLMALATKGSAVWSLRLNASAHETVAEICRAEAQRPGGPGRRLALEPSGPARPFAL
ncbi:MAG: hypothetical protein K8M05_35765 [Deltaproteobacteria bacterium]|nr:hypothetical protein [Kofleriaceae bacterium]